MQEVLNQAEVYSCDYMMARQKRNGGKVCVRRTSGANCTGPVFPMTFTLSAVRRL